MKTIIKCIIAGAIIIGIGLAIVIGVLAFNGWSVKKPTFEMSTFTAETDVIGLEININAGSVKTEFYDGNKITIEYPVSTVFEAEISESNGVLSYSSKKKKVLFWGNINVPDTVIKLPRTTLYDLDFEVNAGSVNIAGGAYGNVEIEINAGTLNSEGLNCVSFDGEVNAGTLNVKKLDCSSIKAEVSAGTLNLDIDGAKAEYNISASVSAGSCNVGSQSVENGKSLVVHCSAGSVKVTFAS